MISKMAASVKSDTGWRRSMEELRGGWQATKKLLRVSRTYEHKCFQLKPSQLKNSKDLHVQRQEQGQQDHKI